MTDKRKKTYAALLAVGFLALVADRFFSSEPAPAAAKGAAEARPALKNDLDAEAGGSDGASMSVTAAHFPRSFEGDLATGPLRDAFGLTPTAHNTLRGSPAGAQTGQDGLIAKRPEPEVLTATQFTEQHRLTAVMTGGGVRVAIVDDQWITLGQTLDECKLVEITGRSVSFTCGDDVARLQVEISGQPAPP